MKNPFDKFDKLEPEALVATPTKVDQSTSVEEVVASVPDEPNAFDEVDTSGSAKLSSADFVTQFRAKLDDPEGGSPAEIIQWSQEVGHPIVPNKDFYDTFKIAADARKKGGRGAYGKVEENTIEELQNDPRNAGIDLNAIGAALRSMGDVGTFNFGDEVVAAGGAAKDYLFGSDKSFDENYRERHADLATVRQLDHELNPTAENVGLGLGIATTLTVPGVPLFTQLGKAKAAVQAGAPLVTKVAAKEVAKNVAKNTALGTVAGAVAGTGEGTPDDRFGKTAEGALVGGGVGAVAPIALTGAARVVRPITERVARNGSISALSRRLGLTGREAENAKAMRELGAEPALIDVTDEQGRNVIGKAGTVGDAREDMQGFVERRVQDFPERTQRQAREVISNQRRTPDELKEGIEHYRNDDIRLSLDPIRTEPLEMTEEIAGILSTREGKRAIDDAISMETNLVARQDMAGLRDVADQLGRLDPRLPARTRQQIIRQIMMDAKFDINATDKIARALNARATGTGADSYTLQSFGRAVRDAAKQNSQYRKIMENYAKSSKAAEAVDAGIPFLTENSNRFADDIGALGTETDEAVRLQRLNQRSPEGKLEVVPSREKPRASRDIPDDAYTPLEEIYALPLEQLQAAERAMMREDYDEAGRIMDQIDDEGFDEEKKRFWKDWLEFHVENNTPIRNPAMTLEEYADNQFHELRYTLPDGKTITGNMRTYPNSDTAIVELYGVDQWDDLAGQYGPSVMRDIGAEVNRLFPQVRKVAGGRITGASTGSAASGKGSNQVQRVDGTVRAPAPIDLARAGAADSTVRALGTRGQALPIAKDIAYGAEQGKRSTALLGAEKAQNLSARMDAEIKRLRNATEQRSSSGPGKAQEGIEGTESTVNSMYNPTSPVTWAREAIRFMSKIGMTEKDARWIVQNATDPAKLDDMIGALQKAGLDRLRAKAYIDVLANTGARVSAARDE